MEGPRDDALEWAVALTKAPTQRRVLRQRSLPSGMEHLLQVAAGVSNDALADAALRTGEGTEDIQEVARFYAREVLFFQGADAYRVLGLNRNADRDAIKAHHRLLQQWLHPDRQTSDWDAIFAGRVNAAWHHLRHDDRRKAYDQANPERRLEPLPAMVPASSLMYPASALVTSDAATRWRRRVPVLGLIAVCGVLGLLVVRGTERDRKAAIKDYFGQEEMASTDAVEDLDSAIALHVPERRTVVMAKPHKYIAHAVPARVAVVASTKRAAINPTPPIPTLQPSTRRTPPPVSVSMTTAPRLVAAVLRSAPAKPTAKVPTPSIVRRSAPQLDDREVGAVAADATRQPSRATAVNAASTTLSASVVPVLQAQRVQQAQQVGSRLISFLSKPSAASPPIWGNLGAQQHATQQRAALHGSGNPSVAEPQWHIGQTTAAMQAVVRYPDGRSGRFSANLVWRDQRWLVTVTSLERDL